MASSLERARSLHEELEVLERSMYTELGDPSSVRLKRQDQIARDQVVASLLNAHRMRSAQLSGMYRDGDAERREEIAAMSGSDAFTTFYERLGAIREYHGKFPSAASMESAEQALLAEVVDSAPDEGFTGEECEGKYVDMHGLHEAYLNLKGTERIDYCAYLKMCANLGAIPKETAITNAYARYARKLQDYLQGFLKRTQPLLPLEKMLEAADEDFDARWARGEVRRWQQPQAADAAGPAAGGGIELSSYSSAKELEALGMEPLKHELMRLGLKCGGSLQQRAERLFLLKTVPLEQIPKQHRAKPPTPAPGAVDAGNDASAANGANRALGVVEERVSRMGELVLDVLEETAAMIEKKQARTYDEIERDLALAAEEADMPEADEDGEEEEDKPIYNPLNLPLGWDGKPIPYWLYKLHGLNLEFKCEICGNYSYWGPRPYERHFQEWRHAYGMKCLGIPNTKHFHGITLIEDAYTLWAKLKTEQNTASFNAEFDEEFEDRSGNVMNRKTYADLARQGLLD